MTESQRTLGADPEPGGQPAGRHVPAFFLEAPADLGPPAAPVQLAPGEEEHGTRVLRLRPGDRAFGLDGSGGRWPLVVTESGRRRLRLEPDGPRQSEPLPGEPGAALPWIEVAVAWPRKQRGEDMLGRLVQLGAAAVTPLEARFRSGPLPSEVPDRWDRIVREHAKQCGRLWLPKLRPPESCGALAGRLEPTAAALLDPGAPLGFDTWVRSLPLGPSLLGTRARPLVLVIGPEGGFDAEERAALLTAGAGPARLGPHVLRVETAAEAALAVAAAMLGTVPRDPLASS